MDEGRLYIPTGVKLDPELFNGFGPNEIRTTFIVGIISIVVNVMLYALHGKLAFTILAIMTVISSTVMCLIKNQYNISVVDQVRFMINFAKIQKKYAYRHCQEHMYVK